MALQYKHTTYQLQNVIPIPCSNLQPFIKGRSQ